MQSFKEVNWTLMSAYAFFATAISPLVALFIPYDWFIPYIVMWALAMIFTVFERVYDH